MKKAREPENSLPSGQDSTLFQEAVKDVEPLPDPGKVQHRLGAPLPLPYQTREDERRALAESLSGEGFAEADLESGEELWFLRPGLSRQVLRKLRRGHWVIQDELDLHGLNREAAHAALSEFLKACVCRGLRCVRVIHGKGLGSRNREPVLKQKVRHWLVQRNEVLAFVQARPADGGGGAVVVLLRAGARG